jgi:hypothetical protein
MNKLHFTSATKLRDFYLEHGFFALYDCSTEIGDIEIEHYSLLKSGQSVSPDCMASSIIQLEDDLALNILERFLKTGRVLVHPNHFTISN